MRLIWETVEPIILNDVKLHVYGHFDLKGVHFYDSAMFFRCTFNPVSGLDGDY